MDRIIIDKLKLKRFFTFPGTLKEAFQKVVQLMGTYNDASTHKFSEGEPMVVKYENPGNDGGYFLAIGRWTAGYPNPVIIPLYGINTITAESDGQGGTVTNIDSIYYKAIEKYFKDGAKFNNLVETYLRNKINNRPGLYNISLTESGDIVFVKCGESGEVADVDKILINKNSMTYLLPIEYIDPDTGELVQKDRATSQDEFNYFVYNLLTWKDYETH